MAIHVDTVKTTFTSKTSSKECVYSSRIPIKTVIKNNIAYTLYSFDITFPLRNGNSTSCNLPDFVYSHFVAGIRVDKGEFVLSLNNWRRGMSKHGFLNLEIDVTRITTTEEIMQEVAISSTANRMYDILYGPLMITRSYRRVNDLHENGYKWLSLERVDTVTLHSLSRDVILTLHCVEMIPN
jgi:hypothetical protein